MNVHSFSVPRPDVESPPPCDAHRPGLYQLVDLELTREEECEVLLHADHCEGCRNYLERLEEQDEILQQLSPTAEEFSTVWSRVSGKLIEEVSREIGTALTGWILARIQERRGWSLGAPSVGDARAILEERQRRGQESVAHLSQRPARDSSLPLTSEAGAMADAERLLGTGCVSLEWARILREAESGNLPSARRRVALLIDTPGPIRRALRSWAAGTPVPVPLNTLPLAQAPLTGNTTDR